MFKELFRKKVPQMIGLDIGTRFIKAVVLEKDGDQYKVQNFACEAISGDAFADREIKDFDAVSNALRKVKMSLKTKAKTVASAVSGSSVITKTVFMDPDQTDFELEGQIEIEADSLIPYPLDEVYLDFEELGESKTHTGKVDVLLSAAHKDMVDGRITLLREVQFEPKVMDIEGYALGNALRLFYPQQEENLVCVNLGATQIQVCVLRDGQVLYSKEHSFGFDTLIQDLSVIHTLDRQEAEQQLMSGELPDTWKQDTYPVFLSNLQQHIARAMQMYISTTHAQRPETILISGGGTAIEGIADDLANELAVNIEIFNPFAAMQVSEKAQKQGFARYASQMSIAAGLASRSFDACHI